MKSSVNNSSSRKAIGTTFAVRMGVEKWVSRDLLDIIYNREPQ